MTLQELVERLQSHPVYQAGRAGDVEVHVDGGLFPLVTRRVRDVRWTAHEDKDYIVLILTSQQSGPMTGESFAKQVFGGKGGRIEGGGHPV